MIYAGLFLQIRRILISQQNKNVDASVSKNEIFDMGAAILFLSLIETEKGSAKLPKQSRCKNNSLASCQMWFLANS